jgi:histidinol-phosphate aminotransferase
MSNGINRRDLFKITGGAALSLAVAGSAIRSSIADEAASPLISLSGNENSYGPSPAAREAIANAANRANRYEYSAQLEFVKKLARKEGVPADHIVLGAGSSEVLCASGLAFCRGDRDTVAADLGFSMVPGYADRVGGNIEWVPLDAEMRHDLDAMAQRVSSNTGMVYVCNPNNPTGTLVDGDRLRDFCTSLPPDVIVVIDEAYLEFSDDFDKLTMLDMVKDGQNVVVTRTFSKIHGLAGARIGYAIARPDLAARITDAKMCKFQGPMAVSAANASLDDPGFLDNCRERAKEGRTLVHGLCEELGLEYTDAVGNFSFIDPKMSNTEFKKRMLSNGLEAARAFPPKADWARVTIGTTEEMRVFAEALPRIVGA